MHALPILVTGGAGYIGSHVCKALHEQNYLPIVFDNLSQGKKEFVRWGPLEVGDLLDKQACHNIFASYRPLAVMHFASLSSVVESYKNPVRYYENNILSICNLLESCIKYKVHYLIFSSSCSIFGSPNHIPIKEEDPKDPISPYGKSKKMIEEILKDVDTSHGIKSISLRYFNAAGADLSGEIGEAHDPETHLIPNAIYAALGRLEKLSIYGNQFPTKDGSAIRDFIHVADLASAHILALRYLMDKQTTTAFHLGSGKGYSVQEILKEVEKVSQRSVPCQLEPSRPAEPSILIADSAKARRELQWNPQYSDIKTIVESAYLWHKK